MGGVCHIRVIHGGKYRVELSRWPFHLQRNLVLAGPPTAIGGAALRVGKEIPVEYGCISVNEKAPVVVRKASTHASEIVHEIELPAGDATLQAWFRNKDNQDILGAYYVRIEKIDQK